MSRIINKTRRINGTTKTRSKSIDHIDSDNDFINEKVFLVSGDQFGINLNTFKKSRLRSLHLKLYCQII